MVDAKKSRIASSTWASVATGDRESLARDSAIRIMASSWRTVMGMDERVAVESSVLCTCRRIDTKWEESFSLAAGERRGAHRLVQRLEVADIEEG